MIAKEQLAEADTKSTKNTEIDKESNSRCNGRDLNRVDREHMIQMKAKEAIVVDMRSLG